MDHTRPVSPVTSSSAANSHFAPRVTPTSYQGTWSSAVTYSQSQSVLYSGAIYYSLTNNNVGNNPSTSPSAWSYLAPGGSQSPCGAATIYGPCMLTVNDLPTIPSSQVSGLGSAATQNATAFDPAGAAAAITLSGLGGVTSAQAAAAAPVQTVAGRTGAITISASDVNGLGSAATQNTSAFDPAGAAAAITLSGLGGVTSAQAAASAPVQSVAGRTGAITISASDVSGLNSAVAAASPIQSVAGRSGAITLSASDITGLGTAATQNSSAFDAAGAAAAITLSGLGGVTSAQAAASAPVQSVAGRTGAISLSNADISGLGTAATQNANAFSLQTGKLSNTFCVGSGGVTANHLVQYDSNGCVIAATAGSFKGIALSTASSGNVEVGRLGIVSCNFENATTVNDMAIQGTTDPTSCRDSGLTSVASIGSTTGVIGGIQTAVAAGNVASVRLREDSSFGTQVQYTAAITGASTRPVTSKVSDDSSLLDFPAVPNGSTDNTAPLTSAWNLLSGNAGTALHVPCFTSTSRSYNYEFASSFSNYLFAGNSMYGDNQKNCGLTFAPGSNITSAPKSIFDWRGSNNFTMHDLGLLAFHNATASYDPGAFVYVGRTATATDGGSNVFDRVTLNSTATGATLYQTNSENFRVVNSSIFNSSPGTGRAWYLSKNDDLGLCGTNCYPANTGTMLSVYAYGDVIVASGGNTALEYKANSGTGDYSFLAGYGYTNTSGGAFLQIDAGDGSTVGGSENSIFDMQDYRIETSSYFARLRQNSTGAGSIAYLLLRGDTFTNNAGTFLLSDSNVTLDKATIMSVNTYGAPSSIWGFVNGWWYDQDSTVTFSNTLTGNVLIATPGHGFVLPSGSGTSEDSNLLINTNPYQSGYLMMEPPGTIMLRAAGAGTGTAHGPSLNVPNGACFMGGWSNMTNGDICMASGSGLYMYDSTGRLNKFLQSSRTTFADMSDHNVYSALNFQQLSTPAAPSVTTANGTGSTAYQYQIVAITADGAHSAVSALSSSISPTNALSSTNCIQMNMPSTSGASYFKIYRTANGTNQGMIANNVYLGANPYSDCGAAGDGTSPSTFASATSITGLSTLTVSTINGGVYSSSGSAPSIAAGAAAGTSPTVSFATSSTANRGQFTVTTGTSPTASGVLATITYTTTTNPLFCTINPANAASAALSGTSMPYVSSTGSTTSFAVSANSTALAASTAYTWTYHCF